MIIIISIKFIYQKDEIMKKTLLAMVAFGMMNFSAQCMEEDMTRTPYLPACQEESHIHAEKIPHQKLENIDRLFYENKSQARIQLFSATQSQGQYELEDLSEANTFTHLYTVKSGSEGEINQILQWHLQKMTAENSPLVRLNGIFPTREQIDFLNNSPAKIFVYFYDDTNSINLPYFHDHIEGYNPSTKIYFKDYRYAVYELFTHKCTGKSAAKHFSTAS